MFWIIISIKKSSTLIKWKCNKYLDHKPYEVKTIWKIKIYIIKNSFSLIKFWQNNRNKWYLKKMQINKQFFTEWSTDIFVIHEQASLNILMKKPEHRARNAWWHYDRG